MNISVWVCLVLDSTPNIASIIPDDVVDARHAGGAKQRGFEGELPKLKGARTEK